MKNYSNTLLSFLSCIAGLFICPSLYSAIEHPIQYKQISTFNNLPSDEVQQVFQDSDGFLWFATRMGLCQYDGYKVSVYKSNLYTPFLFTNNNVVCVADDNNNNLWIGTLNGLNVLDKKTGKVKQYLSPDIPHNGISFITKTRNNQIWIGTEWGMCRYQPETDTFINIDRLLKKGSLGKLSVKSIYEDKDGDLWIGTWMSGLYRYSPSTQQLFSYPEFNKRNSAHTIFQDSNGKMWIGTWREGLYSVDNPKDMANVSFKKYCYVNGDNFSLSDDVVYAIAEDPNTETLWIGTRGGLSIMELNNPGVFVNYRSQSTEYHIPSDEVNSLMCDVSGNMWVASIGGGVWMINTAKPLFTKQKVNLMDKDIPATSARSLLTDMDGNLWIGIGTYGLAKLEANSDKLKLQTDLPEFEGRTISSVYSMLQLSRSKEIWFGTYNDGIYAYKKGEKVRQLTHVNTDFLPSSVIFSLYEDRRANCWIGTRHGVGVSFADGTSAIIHELKTQDNEQISNFSVRNIIEDNDGSIWLATQNYGIIHIAGDVRYPNSLVVDYHGLNNGRMKVNSVLCLKIDRMGRLWAGADGGGLYLYDRANNEFIEKSKVYNLPGDMVGTIQEDEMGHLWLGTNAGLVQLNVPVDEKNYTTRVFTIVDGLSDNFFIPQSFCKRGNEMLFGSYRGYNSFFPSQIFEVSQEIPFMITDIKIFNESLTVLDESLQKRISAYSPSFTRKINIPHDYNNFHIEFASLSYKNPEMNQYAYQLEGFDKDWHYTDATRRFAYYNNLKAGTYKFRLKATNENGVWSGYIRELDVIICPPFWATWWAYIVYIVIGCLLGWFLYYRTKKRILLRNELRMREVEKQQAEELNHAKLQFFTNITHELLTPLTIISATADELKMQAPEHRELYNIMNTSISRLIRLLQQILEFRKAETGNLQLRVSKGDIAEFVRNATESFRPLIKKKRIHFSVLCNPDAFPGYFDTDKLDKILYNLMSNAAKYNKENGFIQVTLNQIDDFMELRIKDNGQGFSKDQQDNLFKRFYEGDYRKFKTIGTGIGLSLTKDLVDLHNGTITVNSNPGEGSEFIVQLPVIKSYYKDDQIDDEAIAPVHEVISFSPQTITETDDEAKQDDKPHTLLLVEDNEELLEVMIKLLQREYNILSAPNGVKAVELLEANEIDLVVSDIMMPEMDGVELCKHIKAKLEISHIPVILLTAKNKEEDRAEAYEIGADAFIMKPFNLAVLHARIRNLLKYKERVAKDFKNQLVFEVKELNYTSVDEDFLQRAIECVNRHLEDCEFDQPQFVEEMGTSKSTLYKKLKSLTGLNTSAFIRNIRLKAACQIMEEKSGSIRVSELAYVVGFNDPKYFSSCFKKEFGMLPTEYMERFILEDVISDD